MNSTVGNESLYVCFDNLRLGTLSQYVIGRIISFWDVYDARSHNEYIGTSLLLLDEKNTSIHVFMPPMVTDECADLKEGMLYKIDNFEISASTEHHQITDHPLVINVNYNTTFIEIPETWVNIGMGKFKVKTYDHLLALANTQLQLPDVVGQIMSVEGPNLYNPTSTHRIIVRLLLQPNLIVSLYVWGDIASRLRAMLYSPSGLDSLVLVTHLKPTVLEGRLYLDSTLSTRFYFDRNILPLAELKERLGSEFSTMFPIYDITSRIAEMEQMSISDLWDYTSKIERKDEDFICHATIVAVLSTYAWNHMRCTTCSGRLSPDQNKLLCSFCAENNYWRDDRFYVPLAVVDGSGTATFIVSNHHFKKLLRPINYEILCYQGNKEGHQDLSACFSDIIGRKLPFQIKVTSYNHSLTNRSFTVATITNPKGHAEPLLSKSGRETQRDSCTGSPFSASTLEMYPFVRPHAYGGEGENSNQN